MLNWTANTFDTSCLSIAAFQWVAESPPAAPTVADADANARGSQTALTMPAELSGLPVEKGGAGHFTARPVSV